MRLPGNLCDCTLKTSSNGDSGILIWKEDIKETYRGLKHEVLNVETVLL